MTSETLCDREGGFKPHDTSVNALLPLADKSFQAISATGGCRFAAQSYRQRR